MMICGLHKKWGGGSVYDGVSKCKWAMWTMRFDDIWWTKGHGTFMHMKKEVY
jgi:hypothetical protein